MRDSVIFRDSVFVMLKGDTTVIERFRTVREVSVRTDTIFHHRIDTISVPVIVEVEKPVATHMSGFRKWVYWLCIGVLLFTVLLFRPALNWLRNKFSGS